MKQISVIVPVFNEEKSIVLFFEAFRKFKNQIGHRNYTTNLLFIDDGSTDQTAKIITDLAKENKDCKAIFFYRNFGKESALFAGLEHANGDLIVPMDVDLQDPFELIFEMLDAYEAGAEVVLARRNDRGNDTFLKRFTAQWFYKLNNRMSTIKLEENVGDFRLMTRQVVNEIVNYSRPVRKEGNTKFNYRKLWNLAVQGITSFSTLPLKVWTYFGSFVAFISFLYGLKIIVEKLFFGINASGYASLMVAILFFGGVQLIGIGVLGEYVGRTYLESKRRPKNIIRKKINNEK